jgi:hypothetical protein
MSPVSPRAEDSPTTPTLRTVLKSPGLRKAAEDRTPTPPRSAGSSPAAEPPTSPLSPASPATPTSASLSSQPPQSSQSDTAQLNHIRSDLVQTIRQVVGVLSQYAGGKALDGDARERVKAFVVGLPGRWKEAMSTGTSPTSPTGPSAAPAAATPAAPTAMKGKKRKNISSPSHSPVRSTLPPSSSSSPPSSSLTPNSPQYAVSNKNMATLHTLLAAQRVLTLATESLDMVRGVTGVMKGSLEGVERWVGVVEESRQGRTASRGGAARGSAAPMDIDHHAQAQAHSRQMKVKQEPVDEMDIDSNPHPSHSRSHSHVSVPANANITMNFPAPASPPTRCQSQRVASPAASAYEDAPSPTAGGREAFGRMRIDE